MIFIPFSNLWYNEWYGEHCLPKVSNDGESIKIRKYLPESYITLEKVSWSWCKGPVSSWRYWKIEKLVSLQFPKRVSGSQVGPYGMCCHVQTRAHGHVLLLSLNLGIYHRRIYLMFTDQVHCMYRKFSGYTQLLWGLQFSIRNLS